LIARDVIALLVIPGHRAAMNPESRDSPDAQLRI
jgi:hypothetical protein